MMSSSSASFNASSPSPSPPLGRRARAAQALLRISETRNALASALFRNPTTSRRFPQLRSLPPPQVATLLDALPTAELDREAAMPSSNHVAVNYRTRFQLPRLPLASSADSTADSKKKQKQVSIPYEPPTRPVWKPMNASQARRFFALTYDKLNIPCPDAAYTYLDSEPRGKSKMEGSSTPEKRPFVHYTCTAEAKQAVSADYYLFSVDSATKELYRLYMKERNQQYRDSLRQQYVTHPQRRSTKPTS